MACFLPAEPAEVAECVSEAAAKRTPLSITGLGSKAALGKPINNAGRLDLSRLDGVTGKPIARLGMVLCRAKIG